MDISQEYYDYVRRNRAYYKSDRDFAEDMAEDWGMSCTKALAIIRQIKEENKED